MALNIDLSPYQPSAVASRDNFFTHYSALDGSGADVIISELFPSYMANRAEDGTVNITDRFISEFAIQLEKFTTRANAIKALNDSAFNPIADIFEKNNTGYLVRKRSDLPGLTTYMSGHRMSFGEAYIFMRPLILFLTQSARCEVFFTFALEDMRVNRYGQMILDKSFNMDTSFNTTLTDIMKVYYFLIVGKPYDEKAPSPKDHGVTLPARISDMVGEVLSGENRFGGVDDFAKQFKYVIEQEGGLPKDDDDDDEDGNGKKKKPLPVLKIVLAGLSLIVVVSVVLLVIFVLIPGYRTAKPDLTDPSLLTAPSEAPPVLAVIDYSSLAVTDPADGSNILEGSYLEMDGALYYRAYDVFDGYYLAKREQNGTENPFVQHVRPAFLTAGEGDGFIYFADGQKNNEIVKVNAADGTSEVISENNALFLCINKGYLYYTNHSDRNRLYRINLTDGTDELYVKATAFETVTDGDSLFFINGDENFSVCSVKDGAEGPALTRLNGENSRNLASANGMLLYIGEEGMVRAMTAEGRPVDIRSNLPAYSFKAAGKWILMIEDESFRLRAFNLDTETVTSLGGENRSAYVWTGGGDVYTADYGDVKTVRSYELN